MSIRPAVRLALRAIPKCASTRTGTSEISRSTQVRGLAAMSYHPSTSSRSTLAAGVSRPTTSTSGSAITAGMRAMSSGGSGSAEETPAELVPSVLSQAEYERISEEDMEMLSENLGALCEQVGNESWEVDYSSGVLTLSIPPHGTYVLNKQPPNQQIWISSPISGPGRFGYVSPTPSDPSTTGPMSSESTLGDDGGSELRGAWTHFRRPGVTLGGLVEGELRVLGVGKDDAEGWLGVGIK